jgi:tRNA threonylcarbamoyladenosine biosynthesis protein TsaB
MSLILHIETSVKSCSVALSDSGGLVKCIEEHADGFVHAEKLHVFIESLFTESEYDFNQLKAVHVSSGPGSFTGLRIGVSAAKGICYGRSIPLMQSGSLDVLYHSFRALYPNYLCEYFVPMIDARRMEVYSTVISDKEEVIVPVQPQIIGNDAFQWLKGKTVLFGDGADKLADVQFLKDDVNVICGIKPSAASMIAEGYRLFEQQRFEDLAYFSPNYLKAFNAEKK